ncbi:MAG: hypothetical protein QOK11_2053 [Pseudonocardiales bacterium]|nr:hypothetical protein [Pseudonocardiales bacterium]
MPVKASGGVWTGCTGTVAFAVVPVPPEPDTVATFATLPALTSSAVIVCDATVQVIDCPGARLVAGQVTVPAVGSETWMLVIVTVPRFVTMSVQSTRSPAPMTPSSLTSTPCACFTSPNFLTGGIVTVLVDGGEVTGGPVGGMPVPVAVLVIEPAFTSAWVTTYVAVHVADAPGAREAIVAPPPGHDSGDNVPVPVNEVSFTVTPVRVTLPVLVTRNE